MSDASVRGEDWAAYLRRMTRRPEWSVARLARDAKINRGTIFDWLKGDSGVTVDSVRRVAMALDDDIENALRAAAGAPAPSEGDEEVALIMRAPVDDELRASMLRKLNERRERDRQRRLEDFQELIELAPKRDE